MADAGWFPDPADPQMLRYWDGAAWTTERRPLPSGAPGGPVPAGPPTGQPWGPRPLHHSPPLSTGGPGPAEASAGGGASWDPKARPTLTEVTPKRRVGVVVLFSLLAVLVLGAAAFAGWRIYEMVRSDNEFDSAGVVIVDGDGDGSVPIDDVQRVLVRHGISCAEPTGTLTHGQLTDFAIGFERGANLDGGTDDLQDWAGALVDAVDDFDAEDDFSVRICGKSLLLLEGSSVRFGMFDGDAPTAVEDAAALGLRLASLAPPPMSEMVEELERTGDTCMATTKTVSRDVLEAELLPRLQPADGAPADAAAGAERDAIAKLPDVELTVRNCNNARIIGADDFAQLIVLGPGAKPLGTDFDVRFRVEIVGP